MNDGLGLAACCGLRDSAFFLPPSAFSEYRAYAPRHNNPKNVLKTSLRSATHATDSTCSGCKANSAATTAGRHCAPVRRRSSRNSSSVLATCNSQARRVMASRLQPIELAVRHVRNPGQRMPVARHLRPQGPTHAFPGQTFRRDRVAGHVGNVVEVDKPQFEHRQVSSHCDERQQEADQYRLPARHSARGSRSGGIWLCLAQLVGTHWKHLKARKLSQ